MNDVLAAALSWLLVPVALYQGLGVRRRTPRLAPPRGAQLGRVGDASPAWRLLVIGDSSAAGVGAERVSETLAPQLARIIHLQTNEAVAWRAAGANSAIASEIRDHIVPNIEARDFTHIVLAVGTNDMKNYLSAKQFKKGFGSLLYSIHARWPQATVIWSPVVDMRDVPAMPWLLARIMAMRTQLINGMGARMCRERQAIAATPLPINGPGGFAIDGFHANAAGYRAWAEHLAVLILDAPAPPASSLQ